MKRRGFMGGLAALVAGGRQAGEAAANAVGQGIGMVEIPRMGIRLDPGPVRYVEPGEPQDYLQFRKREFAANIRRLRHLRKERPDWYVSRMREDLRYGTPLDSDLASHRAMSPAIKRLLQQERQLERMFDQQEEYQRRNLGELLWEHGPGKKLQDMLDSLDPDDLMPF